MSGKFKIKEVRKLNQFLLAYQFPGQSYKVHGTGLAVAYYFSHSVTVIGDLIILQYQRNGINVMTGERCEFTAHETDKYRGFICDNNGLQWVTHEGIIESPICKEYIAPESELVARGCICRTLHGCGLGRQQEYSQALHHRRCSHYEEYAKGDGEYILRSRDVITSKEVIKLPFAACGWVWGNDHFLVFGENGIFDVTDKKMLLEYTNGIICGLSRGVVLIMREKTHANGTLELEWYVGLLQEKPRKPAQGECAVCFRPSLKMMAYNCGHAVVCPACDKAPKCIVCGEAVEQRIAIFSR